MTEKISLKERILKEMVWKEEDIIVYDLMRENPMLLEFLGKAKFETRARQLYRQIIAKKAK